MEILTTGEKIKRARIYKGLTLKDLCGEKISVSKLSCIENDKITVEPETLRFISEKLGVGYEYLIENTRTQIQNNIKIFNKKDNINDYEEVLEYNLNYALENNYYDLSFELMHMLISRYLEEEKSEMVQMLTSQYYDIYNKSASDENYLIYHSDMGRYFFLSKEYDQAVTYYSNIRKYFEGKGIGSSEKMANILYNEMNCLVMNGSYKDALKLAESLKLLIDYVKDKISKGKMFQILAALSLRINDGSFEKYEKLTYENYGEDIKSKCNAVYDFACCIFENGDTKKAIEYINLGLGTYPDTDKDGKVKYMLDCVRVLVENEGLDIAQTVCDEALNISIILDNIRFIEKAYHYKAIILQKQDNYISAEMYMNLSMDALFKCGTKRERYDRYLEMGNMYHKLGQVNDAIRYLTLAMLLEKKL